MTKDEAIRIMKQREECRRECFEYDFTCKDCHTAFEMAIKALEEQTCEDAISREDALMALTGEWTELTDELIHRFIRRIKKLPPVNSQPKWIPVSERPPEIHQDVFLSLRSLDIEVGFKAETEPYYYCHGCYIDPQNVLAWKPLPQPYKPQERSDEE